MLGVAGVTVIDRSVDCGAVPPHAVNANVAITAPNKRKILVDRTRLSLTLAASLCSNTVILSYLCPILRHFFQGTLAFSSPLKRALNITRSTINSMMFAIILIGIT